MHYILAMDQGTTSSRAIVFDDDVRIHAIAQQEYRQLYPQPGWVEHDPQNIWQSQLAVAQQALVKAGITARDVTAIGITNQRETTLLWIGILVSQSAMLLSGRIAARRISVRN